MKKVLWLVLCLILAGVTSFTGFSQSAAKTSAVPKGGHFSATNVSKKHLRIAFLGWANNPFHEEIKKGVVAANKYLKKYNAVADYIVMGEDITLDRAVAALQDAIAKKYDGIVCIPAFDGTEVYINKAVDAGIPVINAVAEGSKPSKRLFFYGQNSLAAGKMAGQLIQKYMGGKGKLGVITGILGATQHEMRKNGALEYLKKNAPKIKVIGIYENNDKAETAYSLTKDMLTANPDLKCIYVTAGGPFGAAKAIQDAGLTGKVGVFGFDWLPDSLKYVKSGEIRALISQDPFGQGFDTCVMMFNYLTTKKMPGKSFVEVQPLVVTPSNLAKLAPEYK